jgi:hypothetical protein
MWRDGEVATFDGVGVAGRGDVLLIVYERDARLHRTRWLFDRADEVAAALPGGMLVYMVVLPTAAPPDAPTRAENVKRLQKIGGALRRLVTTPVGDAFRVSVVRTVMRALSILQGQSRVQFVTSTVDDGLTRLLDAAGPRTPPRSQLVVDLHAVHRALGVEPPAFGRGDAAA